VGPSMMHSQKDLQGALDRSYIGMQTGYRKMFGALDFYVLKIAARSLFRII